MDQVVVVEGSGVSLERDSDRAMTAVAQAREAINLRLLLELRRRLKMAAERELAVGLDRMRSLRGELLRGEAELRLFGRALQTRSNQLLRMAARIEGTQTRAKQTCARLDSLEREHEDLAQQLVYAEQEAASLQRSVQATQQVRNGTLDSLVLAAQILANDLAQAKRDQARLRERGADLLSDGQALAERAGALRKCFLSLGNAVAMLCDEISVAVDGLPLKQTEIKEIAEAEHTLDRREAQVAG